MVKLTQKLMSDTDYNEAYNFCKEVENWWEGSDGMFDDPERTNDSTGTNYVDFFSKFNKTLGSDLDKQAAEAYENMIINHLEKEIDADNKFYTPIKNWLLRIVDEIDGMLQEPCTLSLKSNDGRADTFMVDPEIDVDGFFGL